MKVFMGRYPKDGNKERKIRVKIDSYDTWSMDHTLAHIIVPMLIQLRDTAHGAPGTMPAFSQTDNQPQGSFDFYKEDNEVAWDTGHQQWVEILNKMIWSFEQIRDDNWESQYWTGEIDMVRRKVPGTDLVELYPGPNHTRLFDKLGFEAHAARIQEGVELFGKYYQSLWD